MPNHDRFECQTAIDSDAILQALRDIIREAESKKPSRRSSSKTASKKTDSARKDGIDMNNN
ncbi:TPA: hypothetical protein MH421_26410 [Klebsiella pneumoniae]|nr:hypothetical protein [Klebsiella pneumoniae]